MHLQPVQGGVDVPKRNPQATLSRVVYISNSWHIGKQASPSLGNRPEVRTGRKHIDMVNIQARSVSVKTGTRHLCKGTKKPIA